jgi:hypothetical protein
MKDKEKNTIIPLKFYKNMSLEDIDIFVDFLLEYEKKTGILVHPISMTAVANRVNKNKQLNK